MVGCQKISRNISSKHHGLQWNWSKFKSRTGIKDSEEIKPNNESVKNINPFITWVGLMLVMLVLSAIMFIFPDQGINIGNSNLQFPGWKDFLLPNQKSDSLEKVKEELTDIFDSTVIVSEVDSTIIKYKLDSLKKYRQSLQISDKGKPAIDRFFSALDGAKKKKVRIMHYGDSQIEADRITSYLRNELQKKFGGYGVGLFPIVQVAPKMSVNITYSDNWKRYAGFGKKDTTVKHKRYGVLMNFARFTPIPKSTKIIDTTNHQGWIKIRRPKASYGRTKSYTKMKVFLSNTHINSYYSITADGSQVNKGILSPNTPFQTLSASFPSTPNEISIVFEGRDSPDIYGISLEGSTGVNVDNIPLRGSSGTVFTKQDATLLANMFATLSPDLIIMEFGGNTVPYIKSEKSAGDYGRWFKSQINFVKRLNRKAAIIVIGPGDMSYKKKTEYLTYPFLESIRDALRDAAISSGCIFWDMYEVMGGKNSMKEWVNTDPPLAASDYTHFTPKGAKKIAEEFSSKLFEMYDHYKNPNKKDTLSNDSIQ